SVEIEILNGQVPVSVEDFKAALFFLLVGILVGEELLQKGSGVEVVVGDLGVLEDDGGAKIPAAIFGGVVAGDPGEDFEDAAEVDFLFQDGVMVLLEQGDKFFGVAPLGFVVVLDDVRLVGGVRLLRRVGLRLQSA